MLENTFRSAPISFDNDLKNYKIEHIIPENLNQQWNHITEAEHTTFCNTLGNITIKSKEQELKNLSFQPKRERLLIEAGLNINRKFLNYDIFNTSDLEDRAIKLLDKFISEFDIPDSPIEPEREDVLLDSIAIPLCKEPNESVQNYVQRIMFLLLNNHILNDTEISNIKSQEYSNMTFSIGFPLLRDISQGTQDDNGYDRYWAQVFGEQYYVCSQWIKGDSDIYLTQIKQWLLKLEASQ